MDLQARSAPFQRPELFCPSTAPLWTDPHISREMLKAHLDPTTDAASRKPETIRKTVDWIVSTLDLRAGTRVLDLGCGPGLYAVAFAERSLYVTGLDQSTHALDHARSLSAEREMAVTWLHGNYVTDPLPESFDLVTLIYYDFGVQSPPDRDALLARIRRSLDPAGAFVFDVLTPASLQPESRVESTHERGFWRPTPYHALQETFVYPARNLMLRQHTITDAHGTETYRIWNQAYTPDSITTQLTAAGFTGIRLFEDLQGSPLTDTSPSLGIIARA